MTPEAFATQLDRLNTALTTGDDTEAQAAIYAMDWVAPGSVGLVAHRLIAGMGGSGKNSAAVFTATRDDWGVDDPTCAGCTYDGHRDDFAPPHTCGK